MKKQVIGFVLVVVCLHAMSCSDRKDMELYKQGIDKYDLKDYQGAIADYTKAIGLKPDYADAYNNQGVAKFHLEDYQGAIADYTKAIELRPDDGGAYKNRGNAYLDLGQKEKALSDYLRAIKLGYSVRQETLDMCR